LAVATRVDLLVSGDRDLTALEDAPVQIATPRELLDRLNAPT
jgi:predicted nucleic acid-binding protein